MNRRRGNEDRLTTHTDYPLITDSDSLYHITGEKKICCLLCIALNSVTLEVLHAGGSEVLSGSDFHTSIGSESGVTVSDLDLLVVRAVVQEEQGDFDALSADFESRLSGRLDQSFGDVLAGIEIGSTLNSGTINLRVRQVHVSRSRSLHLGFLFHARSEEAPAGTDGHSAKSEETHPECGFRR